MMEFKKARIRNDIAKIIKLGNGKKHNKDYQVGLSGGEIVAVKENNNNNGYDYIGFLEGSLCYFMKDWLKFE